ncbi:hypothetical protein OCU04_008369 [Sclerotinia nivalis]|uniref:Uncharacterized protein n=1 Tax=Sclerotinia nivalis TaxID=352851 RepID=A0A9X0AHX8_9HELO|nr:hypothetical protein OCU04_008369 [Sclerotinia nivalis]
MNPKISMDALTSFIEYVGFVVGTRLFDNYAALRLVEWGARTNFIHFTPDTLPIILALILCDLVASGELSTNFKCLRQLNFHDITRRNNEIASDCVLQEQSKNCMTNLNTVISQWIRISNETAPYSLERMFVGIIPSGPYLAFNIIQALLNNDIKLDFNWRSPEDAGNTIIHKYLYELENRITHRGTRGFIEDIRELMLNAALQHGADLTVPDDNGTTSIELLVRDRTLSESMFQRIWESGKITNAITRLSNLPEKLLQAAIRSPERVEYIFHQLAKDEDIHSELL